jgi:hypothetical protein
MAIKFRTVHILCAKQKSRTSFQSRSHDDVIQLRPFRFLEEKFKKIVRLEDISYVHEQKIKMRAKNRQRESLDLFLLLLRL